MELSEILYGKSAGLKEVDQPKRKWIKQILFCAIAWLVIVLLIEVLYEIMLQISIGNTKTAEQERGKRSAVGGFMKAVILAF